MTFYRRVRASVPPGDAPHSNVPPRSRRALTVIPPQSDAPAISTLSHGSIRDQRQVFAERSPSVGMFTAARTLLTISGEPTTLHAASSQAGLQSPAYIAPMTETHRKQQERGLETAEKFMVPRIKRKNALDPSDRNASFSRKRVKAMRLGQPEVYEPTGHDALFDHLRAIRDDGQRLAAKEQKKETGRKHILAFKEYCTGKQTPGPESNENLADILLRIAALEKKLEGREVLVGVCGGTGVGKTSLLNACIGFEELLPSGQDGATTAVPCRVSYNYAMDHDARAEVYFKPKEAIVQEVLLFLQTFNLREEALNDNRDTDAREYTKMIDSGMERFAQVWDIDEEQLAQRLFPDDDEAEDEGMLQDQAALNHQDEPRQNEVVVYDKSQVSPAPETSKAQADRERATLEWLFGLNSAAEQLLNDGSKTMKASTPEDLATQMKKYLDSTETSHGSNETAKFAAWPLVEEVRVFVKSDLLRHGICLVDLPGVSDANKSRSEVGDRYMAKLDLIIVVGRIHRAKDTSDFRDLLGAQQETAMKLDGTLDKNHFAVVFTQIDDIEADKYYFRDECDAELFKKLSDRGEEDKAKADRFNRRISRLEKARARAQKKLTRGNSPTDQVSRTARLIGMASEEIDRLITQRGIAEVSAKVIHEGQVHLAIGSRNHHLRKSVESDFTQRQSKHTRRRGRTPAARASVALNKEAPKKLAEVFATSARGFWGVRNKDGKGALPGMPTERYTGIPALKQWIRKNAALRLEAHLDDVLSDMGVIMGLIDAATQSSTSPSASFQPRVTPAQFAAATESVHDFQKELVQEFIVERCLVIDRINPMGSRESLYAAFKKQERNVVERWNRKYPHDCLDTQVMAWRTYDAIIRHLGCWSGGKNGVAYDWIPKLAQIILEGLLPSWEHVFADELRTFRADTVRIAGEIFEPYPGELVDSMAQISSSVPLEVSDIENIVRPSVTSLQHDIEASIRNMGETAARLHHETVCPTLRQEFQPIFSDALTIHGPGQFARRQRFLVYEEERRSRYMFEMIWNTMAYHLEQTKRATKKFLMTLAEKPVEESKIAIGFRLNRVIRHRRSNKGTSMHSVVQGWKKEWLAKPQPNSSHELVQQLGIPDTLLLGDLGADHSATSARGVSYHGMVTERDWKCENDICERDLDKLEEELDLV